MEMSIGLRPSCGLTVAESPRLTIRYCSPRDNRPFWLLFNETSATFSVISCFLFSRNLSQELLHQVPERSHAANLAALVGCVRAEQCRAE